MNWPERLSVAAALLVLLVCGFLYFPGHTFLQSDTQIYLPILDRLADPSLYRQDPVAYRPHVSYTIYDEAALGLRAATGLGFREVLTLQQLVYRFLGLIGVFLMGRACGLATPWAVLLASVYGLGGTIYGPSVLIAEYEPVPRGYAVALLLFALGLAARDRWIAAGCAAGLAVLYHPPTTVPVLIASAATLWLTRAEDAGRQRWRAAVPVAAAAALLFVLSRLQHGATEPQQFFATLDPALEKLQRLRGSYNFVSIWIGRWWTHWLFVAGLGMLAWSRLRAHLPRKVTTMAFVLMAYGLLTVPLSFVLLEQLKWSLMPQFQPARALLWVTLLAMLGAALNGIRAAQDRRTGAALLWFAAAYLLTGQADPIRLPGQALSDATMRARLLVFLGLGGVAALAVRTASMPVLALALALPFHLIPEIGKVTNYPPLDHPEVHALADWARATTGKDTVFQFPDAGQALYPGLFRVFSQRTVYVDWKVGGQVNLLKDFADDWWKRWQAAGEPKVEPARFWQDRATALAALGIDYVVLQPAHRLPDRAPDFENAKYLVYRLPR